MIYFDNAATTFYKPPAVIDAAVYAMKNLSVNPGRRTPATRYLTATIRASVRESWLFRGIRVME